MWNYHQKIIMEKILLYLVNNLKKFLLFSLCVITFTKSAKAQDNILPCGTSWMVQKEFEKNPDIFLKNKAILDSISILYENRSKMISQKIIPVVFHVLHEGGPIGIDENISKEQIEDAISIMNEDFNAENEDLINVIPEFESIIGDVQLTFKLAKIDPEGNCTEGITRTYWSETGNADDDAKQVIFWDDESYLNIWVVKSIDSSIGAAAYTYIPATGGPNFKHGIIANNEYVGSIGTGSNSSYVKHTLSHEVGHFFNLEHTWAEWAEVGLSSNCNEDDFVNDTPNCIGSYSSCNLSSTSCGTLDNVQNFMDYSSCTCMFTQGQANRMEASLNSNVGARVDLWQDDNLWETGTHPSYESEECLATIDFYVPNGTTCLGEETQFFNNSYNTGENPIYYWSFPGGIPSNSTEESPTVVYNNSGLYNVSLSITNDAGTTYLTEENYITVLNQDNNIPEIVESFENYNFPTESDSNLPWVILEQDTETSWNRTETAYSEGIASMRIRSRFFSGENLHILYTPFINLTSFNTPVRLYFDYAYAKRNSQSEDLLRVLVSDDCGVSWTERKDLDTDNLVTNGGSYISTTFVPNFDQWEEEYVNLNPWSGSSSIQIKFEFSGENGNYLYIDNIRLQSSNSDLFNFNIESKGKLVKVIDLLGREVPNFTKNQILFFIYDNGLVEQKQIIE